MAKSEMPYWGYDDDLSTTPKVNKSASDWASLTQFALFYIYMSALAFSIFGFWGAWINIFFVFLNHWCGVEDLKYFLLSNVIKLPKEYTDTHPNYLGIPDSLYWLSEPRLLKFFRWTIKIPSVIGLICGKDVPRVKFVLLTILVIIITIILGVIL
jgi:hypothetical protein